MRNGTGYTFLNNTFRRSPVRSFLLACAILIAPTPVFAVVAVEVGNRDVPMIGSASVSFTDIEGEDREVRVTFHSGGSTIEIDGPINKIKGGELTIKPEDGTPQFSPVIPMDWDGKSPLRLDPAQQSISHSPAPLDVYSGVDWGMVFSYADGRQDVPVWGSSAGIAFAPGNEVRLLPTNDERSFQQRGIAITTPSFHPPAWAAEQRITFGFNDASSHDDGQGSEPIGGENVFGVFDTRHDGFLGTGIFAGPAGSETDYDYDWERTEYLLQLSWLALQEKFEKTDIRPRVKVFWGTEEIEWQSSNIFQVVPNLSIRTQREIDSDFWGVSLGVEFSRSLGSGFNFDFGAGIIYQDRDTTTESSAAIDALGTPVNLNVRTRQSDSDVGGELSIGFSYEPNPHVRIALSYDIVEGIGNLGGTSPVDGDEVVFGREVGSAAENGWHVYKVSAGLRF